MRWIDGDTYKKKRKRVIIATLHRCTANKTTNDYRSFKAHSSASYKWFYLLFNFLHSTTEKM